MKITYTVKSDMPLPTVNMVENKLAAIYRDTDKATPDRLLVAFNIDKLKEWLNDTASLLGHSSVLFATVSNNRVVASLTDEAVASEYNAKWGAA